MRDGQRMRVTACEPDAAYRHPGTLRTLWLPPGAIPCPVMAGTVTSTGELNDILRPYRLGDGRYQ